MDEGQASPPSAWRLSRIAILAAVFFAITTQLEPTSVAFGIFAMATGASLIALVALSVLVAKKAVCR